MRQTHELRIVRKEEQLCTVANLLDWYLHSHDYLSPGSKDHIIYSWHRFFGVLLDKKRRNAVMLDSNIREWSHLQAKARVTELLGSLSSRSVIGIIKDVRSVLEWGVQEGYLQENLAAGLRLPRGTKTKRRKRQLRHSNSIKLGKFILEQAQEGDVGALACLCALVMGWRAGSICSIHVEDFDHDLLPCDLVYLREGKTDLTTEHAYELPEMLRHLMHERAIEVGQGPLFTKENGNRADRTWLYQQTSRLCRGAAVPHVTPHGLRGMMSSMARRSGVPAKMVADALAHTSESTTLGHYVTPGADRLGHAQTVIAKLGGE